MYFKSAEQLLSSTTVIHSLFRRQQQQCPTWTARRKLNVERYRNSTSPQASSLWSRFEKKWSQIQVGHQGSYSIERLELLHEYCQTTSFTRVILVCLLTPVPALLAAVLLEYLRLRSPSEGWEVNWMFWIRHGLVTLLIFGVGNLQLDLYVPENNTSVCRQLVLALVTCAAQMGTYFAETVAIGFPVPFMWQLEFLRLEFTSRYSHDSFTAARFS